MMILKYILVCIYKIKLNKHNKNNLYWKGEGGVKTNLMNLII